MAEVVSVRNVTKHFSHGRSRVRALNNVSFTVAGGEVFGLLGPNGAGKTTLCEILTGFLECDSGAARVFGADVRTGRGKASANRRENTGVQFQEESIIGELTVLETLRYFRSLYGKGRDTRELLAAFLLEEAAKRRCSALSGGLRKRLFLALAFLNDPTLVFLDEPTTGLDPHSRRMVWQVIEKEKAAGTSILLTTHYIEEAEALCGRVGFLYQGSLVDTGTPQDLIQKYIKHVEVAVSVDQRIRGIDSLQRLEGVQSLTENFLSYTFLVRNDLHFLEKLFRILDSENVHITSLDIRRPKLEDVFLEITRLEKDENHC